MDQLEKKPETNLLHMWGDCGDALSMTERGQEVIAALKKGHDVFWAGHSVTATEMEFSWQVPTLWINSANGSSYKASWSEIEYATIIVN